MGAMNWYFGGGTPPNVEQNLLVSPCKHLYCTKELAVKYQQKPIDSLRAGNKRLLTRVLALDVGTGAYYGEIHTSENVDVLGFLARAWIKKPDHFMHGVPRTLNLPRAVQANDQDRTDIELLQQLVGFATGALPSGFKAGARQIGMFEEAIASREWDDDGPFLLWAAQALSAICSHAACQSSACFSLEAWAKVDPLPATFREAVDDEYEKDALWRDGAWRVVVDGAANYRASSRA